MDIGMPEMDGLEASSLICQRFQEGKISKKPYIAAITAYDSEDMRKQAANNGMDKFLTKCGEIKKVSQLI